MVRRKLTNKDILSLPKLYNSGLSSWAIAKKFNTCHSDILYHLKKLGLGRRNRSSAAKEGVKAGRILIKKNLIPKSLKLNEDLAYILGVLCGDGYMDYSNDRRTHYIGLSATDKEFVDNFKSVLHNYFKIKPTNEFRKSRKINWRDQYITRMCSKEACDFINKLGRFGKFEWNIPEAIMNSDNNLRIFFLKGFFDSEGEIDKQSGRVGATSANFIGLNQIGKLLKDLKINFTIIKVKDARPNTHQKYKLRVHDKKSIISFRNLIGFNIKRKQEVLDNVKEVTMFPRDRDRLTP